VEQVYICVIYVLYVLKHAQHADSSTISIFVNSLMGDTSSLLGPILRTPLCTGGQVLFVDGTELR